MKVLRSTRPREDVQGDEVRAGVPEGRRTRARQHLVARAGRRQEGPLVRRRAGVALPERATAATPGRWSPGISNHAHARKWQPGNGGLCLHTILRDGDRVHVGISTGGHYLSEDGGDDLPGLRTRASAPASSPDPYPEFGQCVHKIAGHPDAPGRLYMQNHGGWAEWDGPGGPRPDIGVLRSDDHGQYVAIDRQGAAVRLRLPDRRAPARSGHRLRRAARAVDAHVPGRRAGRVAQRERRRLVEPARPRAAAQEELLHRPARRDGHRRAEVARACTSAPPRGSCGSAATAARNGSACSTSLPPIHCVKVAVV